MSPQVKKPVPSRRYFPQNLLGREASKKLVRAINLGVPCFQPESYVRAFVSHGFVSYQLLRLICILKKSSLQALGGKMKPGLRTTPIQIQVVLGQGSADLLMIVVVFIHDAGRLPPPNGLPFKSALSPFHGLSPENLRCLPRRHRRKTCQRSPETLRSSWRFRRVGSPRSGLTPRPASSCTRCRRTG